VIDRLAMRRARLCDARALLEIGELLERLGRADSTRVNVHEEGGACEKATRYARASSMEPKPR